MTPSNPHASLLEASYQHDEHCTAHHCQEESNDGLEQTHTDIADEIVRVERESYTWRIADFGSIGSRSRDASIHATDEVFNAASHLSATLLSILGTVLLITQSSDQGNPWKIVSFSLYGASLIFLFLCSTLHHSITGTPKVELLLRTLDYVAIYPLIAGTFTPLCLVFYHDSSIGWAFCMVVWGISLLGMVVTSVCFVQIPKWMTMTVYITLGWMGACMTYWLLPMLHWTGFGLFLVGGVCYTGGGFIYTTEQPNPIPGRFGFHELWHIAVISGAFCHWCLMFFYVLPWDP
jgi:hemolysin III